MRVLIALLIILSSFNTFAQLRVITPKPGDVFYLGDTISIKVGGVGVNDSIDIMYSHSSQFYFPHLLVTASKGSEYKWDTKSINYTTELDTGFPINFYVRKHLTATPSIILKGHTSAVSYARYSYDGSFIATCCNDGTCRIYNGVTGNFIKKIVNKDSSIIRSFQWNPKQNTIATLSSNGIISIWDSPFSVVIKSLKDSLKANAFSWNPYGNKIAAFYFPGSKFKFWNTFTGQVSSTLTLNNCNYLRNIMWSTDGLHILATGNCGICRISNSGSEWKVVNSATGYIDYASFNHKGDEFYIGTYYGHHAAFTTFPMEPIATYDNPNSGETEITNYCGYIKYSDDDKYVAVACGDRKIRIGRIVKDITSSKIKIDFIVGSHFSDVKELIWSHDNKKIWSCSNDEYIRLWDIGYSEVLGYLSGHTRRVNTIDISPDKQFILSSSDDSTARIWKVSDTVSTVDTYSSGLSTIYKKRIFTEADEILLSERILINYDDDSRIRIHLPDNSSAYIQCAVYDILGNAISVNNLLCDDQGNVSIDISTCSNGLYIIVLSHNGKRYSKSILVNR